MSFFVKPELVDEIVGFVCDHDLAPGDILFALVEEDGWLATFFDERQTCGFTANEVQRFPTRWYRLTVAQLLSLIEAFEPASRTLREGAIL